MDMKVMEKAAGAKAVKAMVGKTVAIIGLGGVGSTLAQILARNGINLRVIDKDRVLEADAPRQTLYKAEDNTKFKAKQAKKHLEEMVPTVKVKAFHEELIEDNIFLIEADVIVDASNDMKTSLMIDKFAKSKKIPLVFANYSGEKGHVLFVDKKPKSVRVADIETKLSLPAVKEAGVFSPVTALVAGATSSAVISYLMNGTVDEHLLTVDGIANKIQHNKVEKPKKK